MVTSMRMCIHLTQPFLSQSAPYGNATVLGLPFPSDFTAALVRTLAGRQTTHPYSFRSAKVLA